jgi:hypothetical protein
MNFDRARIRTAHDRIRYVLSRVNQLEASWTPRELFFLVKKSFPTETQSRISAAAAALCSLGEFSVIGRRYQANALKPVKCAAPPGTNA